MYRPTLLLTLLTAASAAAQPVDLSKLQGLGEVHHHVMRTEDPGRTYHVFVSLPAEAEARTEPLPTIYLLDGGITFPLLKAYHRYLALGGEAPQAVVVGISYGSDDFARGNLRGTDFTAASEEREHYGGAPVFQAFLAERLIPFVEERYPSRPDRRIVFGQSLGGQFVLYTALTRPTLFWGHIASNPALHRNLPFFLAWRGEGETPRTASRLFVSSGSRDVPVFREPAVRWMDHWTGPGVARPWDLEVATLDGHSHFSPAAASFRAGMAWLFPKSPDEGDRP